MTLSDPQVPVATDAIGKVYFGIERRYREAHQAPPGEKRSNVRVPHKRRVRIESAVRG